MAECDDKISDLLGSLSPALRAMTVGNFTAEFIEGDQSAEDRTMAVAIFRGSLRDDSVEVRRILSEDLKLSSRVPHDIALVLAKDIPDVALPFLENSPVLSDTDLIEIVDSMESDHQLAVARRKHLSERVSVVLVETKKPPVVATLTKNPGAQIAPITYNRIIYIFPDNDLILGNIVRRSSLPKRTVRELFGHLSGELLSELGNRHSRPKEFDEDKIANMSDEDILEFVDIGDEPEDVDDLVHQINRIGRLSPTMIVQSMCLGDFSFFEHAMAELANIRCENAHKLIFDAGPLGLEALQSNTGFPKSLMDVVRLLVILAKDIEYHGGGPRYHSRFYRSAMKCLDEKYGNQASQNLSGFLNRLAA